MERIDRRRLLGLGLVIPVGVLAGCTDDGELTPTPTCADADDETPAQTEGPYFTPDSPERADLREAGMGGAPLLLTGRVLDTSCKPVAGALLDFWQADDQGRYDNEGYRLRGHQFAAADGSYRLSTIVPARYTGRAKHIHVKVQRPGGAVLTTQLYFPGEAGNDDDRLFNEALVLSGYPDQPEYTFVLEG